MNNLIEKNIHMTKIGKYTKVEEDKARGKRNNPARWVERDTLNS